MSEKKNEEVAQSGKTSYINITDFKAIYALIPWPYRITHRHFQNADTSHLMGINFKLPSGTS